MANIRTQMDGFTSPLVQMTMYLFMEEGHFPRTGAICVLYRGQKRNALIEGLASMRYVAGHGPGIPPDASAYPAYERQIRS